MRVPCVRERGLVLASGDGAPAHETQPINHWVRSGQNKLEVFIYDEDGRPPAGCKVKTSVLVGDANDDKVPETTVLTLAYSGHVPPGGHPTGGSSREGTFDSTHGYRASDQGDVKVGPPELVRLTGGGSEIQVLSRTFDFHVPFPGWAFFKGEPVKQGWQFKDKQEMTPTYQEIFAAYLKLWTLLQKKDVNGFLDACEERSREMDVAYFKHPGATRAQLRKDLESAVNDPKLDLYPITKDPHKFFTYAVGSTGKLITLTSGAHFAAILRFPMKDDTPFSMTFPITFRKEGDRFIVTR